MMATAQEAHPLRVGHNALWNLLQYGAGKLTTLVSTLILARLLAPEAFGVVALAMLAINLFDNIKDLGVGPALVQLDRPWVQVQPTGLTLTFATSVLFGTGAVVAAPGLAAFLGSADLTPIIRALAISLLISGLAIIPDSALRRRLQFRLRTIPELSGVALKAAVSIYLAFQGWGAWSLVWGQVVASVATTAAYWIVARRTSGTRLRFGWSNELARSLLGFGGWVSGVAILSLVLSNIDYFAIGRRLGVTELGYYTMAYRLPEMLIFGIGMIIGQVLFASFSRLQADTEALGRMYLESTSVVSALMVPAAVGLSAAAEPIVMLMLGPVYAPAIGVLTLLGIRSAFSAISIYAGEAFKAKGRADILLRIAMIQVVLVVPLFWFAAGYSIYAVAGAFTAQTLLFALVQLHMLRRVLFISGRRQWTLTWPTLAASGIMWLSVRGILATIPEAHPLVQLTVAILVGMATYASALRVLSPAIFYRMVRLIRRRSVDAPVWALPATPGTDKFEDPPTVVSPLTEPSTDPSCRRVLATSKRPVRVLHVLDSFSFGGAENLVADLARFAPSGMELRVASLAPQSSGRNEFRDRLDAAGLRPFYFDVPRLLAPRGFSAMVRRLRAGDIDVVHAHLGYSATLLPLAARLAGVACVATLHVMPTKQGGREVLKERLSIRSPERWGILVHVSQAAFDGYAARYTPLAGSWRIIHNGIDVNRFNRSPVGTQPAPVWAVIAALREEKGHIDLLAAWADVVISIPEARLIVAGDGPFERRIREQAQAFGIGASVSMNGRCDDVPALLAQVSGVVSASHSEALPTTLIEAAAAGLPTIATDVGGTAEVVRHMQTGLLVPPREPAVLAKAIIRLHSEPDLAHRLGAEGRRRAQTEFSMEAWTKELRDLYQDALSSTRLKRNDRARAVDGTRRRRANLWRS